MAPFCRRRRDNQSPALRSRPPSSIRPPLGAAASLQKWLFVRGAEVQHGRTSAVYHDNSGGVTQAVVAYGVLAVVFFVAGIARTRLAA
jgi:hypothetical protein